MLTSELKLYSIGKVINDIIEDSLYIDVYPIEKIPNYSGSIKDEKTFNIKTKGVENNNENIVVDKSVRIKAKWVNLGSNRVTPPMVCKGETVLLFRYSNTDRFYWIPMYNEQMIRKNEKATFVFSNRKTITPDGSELDKAYFITIDTINKVLHLHTDDSDGELTTYDFNLDTKKGILNIFDGRGNFITLNSANDELTVHTNNIINIVGDNTINRQTTNLNEINDTTVIHTKKNRTETIGEHNQINLNTLSIKNSTDEIVSLISETLQAIMDAKWVGNLGAEVPITGETNDVFKDIKARWDTFKK